MIAWKEETIISLAAAAKMLPGLKPGKTCEYQTIRRWAMHGYRGVKLDSIRMGSRLFTSEEAICRFFGKINGFPIINSDDVQISAAATAEQS